MIIEWLYYKAATCSAIVKCDLMRPLWASILRGLYLGQNCPSRLKLGRQLSLITVIFLFWIKKMELLQCFKPIHPHISKGLDLYPHKLWTLDTYFQIRWQLRKNQKASLAPVSILLQGFHREGLILPQAIAARSLGNHYISNKVCGDVKKASAVGLDAFRKQVRCIFSSHGATAPSHSSFDFLLA